MSIPGVIPNVLALIQEIHTNLDQADYPLSRVVAKVIRVATLLGDYEGVVRFKVEMLDSPDKTDLDRLFNELKGRMDPVSLYNARQRIVREWFTERDAAAANMGKDQDERQSLIHSLPELEKSTREMNKGYQGTFESENSYWFRNLAVVC